jgi:hypothetical protein
VFCRIVLAGLTPELESFSEGGKRTEAGIRGAMPGGETLSDDPDSYGEEPPISCSIGSGGTIVH